MDDKLYPRSVVSEDGHSLEVRNLQVKGCVHFHRCRMNSCYLGTGSWVSYSPATLEPLTIDQRSSVEVNLFTDEHFRILSIRVFYLTGAQSDALSHRFSVLSSVCRWWAISWCRIGQSSATSNMEISSRTCSSLVSDAKTFSAKALIFSSVSVRSAHRFVTFTFRCVIIIIITPCSTELHWKIISAQRCQRKPNWTWSSSCKESGTCTKYTTTCRLGHDQTVTLTCQHKVQSKLWHRWNNLQMQL